MIERYDLLLVLSIPFFIAGLGLVHWFCDTRTRAVGWLFIFYLTFTVYPVYISLLLIVLALIDSAIDVRKRVMKEVNCDENHSVRKNP